MDRKIYSDAFDVGYRKYLETLASRTTLRMYETEVEFLGETHHTTSMEVEGGHVIHIPNAGMMFVKGGLNGL